MKDSYFGILENKYSCCISLNKPIVIRLDGKDICKNHSINVFNESFGGFAYALQQTAKELSKRCHALVLISSDEISVIFLDTDSFYEKFKSCKCQKSSSLITQDVSVLFNHHYKSNFTYFDARTFNIPENKIMSYLRFRTKSAKNVSIQYFAKRCIPFEFRKGKKLHEVEDMLINEYATSIKFNDYHLYGKAYYDGNEIDLKRILESNTFDLSKINEFYIKQNIANINTLNIDIDIDVDDI